MSESGDSALRGEMRKSRKREEQRKKEYQMNVLASQALPEVEYFSRAKGDKEFEEFIEQLEMKYLDIMSGEKMVTILKSHLVGDAKRIFESVTRGKQLSYSAIVRQMRQRYKGDVTLNEYEATMKWENLEMAAGEDIMKFTLELEEMAVTAYPTLPDYCLSSLMAKKLIAQLSHWREYEELIKVMEEARKGEKYEEVKAAAIRMEMLEKRGRKLGMQDKHYHGQGYRGVQRRQSRELEFERDDTEQGTSNRRGYKSPQHQNSSSSYERVEMEEEVENEEELGSDIQRRSFVVRRTDKSQSGKSNNWNENALAWCGGELEEKSTEDNFWAPLTEVEVKLNGVRVRAIVDTGSEVSIVPVNLMRRIKRHGQIEKVEVKEEIIEAAGSRLSIAEKSNVQMEIAGVVKKVGIFAMADSNEILLGQNVIALWGLECLLNLSDAKGDKIQQRLCQIEKERLEWKEREQLLAEQLEDMKSRLAEVKSKCTNAEKKDQCSQADVIDELDQKLFNVEIANPSSEEEATKVETNFKELERRLGKLKNPSECGAKVQNVKSPRWWKCHECGGFRHGRLSCPTRRKRILREMRSENWRELTPKNEIQSRQKSSETSCVRTRCEWDRSHEEWRKNLQQRREARVVQKAHSSIAVDFVPRVVFYNSKYLVSPGKVAGKNAVVTKEH